LNDICSAVLLKLIFLKLLPIFSINFDLLFETERALSYCKKY
jgi:hypothetical protein